MPTEIKATVEISPSLQRLILQNKEIAPRAINRGMKYLAQETPKNVKKTISSMGLVRTGDLKKSIKGKTKRHKAIIGTDLYYAHMLEGGTKPHKIKPKNKQFLYISGRFVKEVNHPGIKAYKFLDTSVQKMEQSGELESLFARGVREAIEELS
jgi:phage gpG-like protein